MVTRINNIRVLVKLIKLEYWVKSKKLCEEGKVNGLLILTITCVCWTRDLSNLPLAVSRRSGLSICAVQYKNTLTDKQTQAAPLHKLCPLTFSAASDTLRRLLRSGCRNPPQRLLLAYPQSYVTSPWRNSVCVSIWLHSAKVIVECGKVYYRRSTGASCILPRGAVSGCCKDVQVVSVGLYLYQWLQSIVRCARCVTTVETQ